MRGHVAGIVPALEKHHKVRILDEGLVSAVKFSHRYLAGRQLPDKAVSVLDTACARLALGQSATPPAIEDATRQLDDLEVEQRILERESALGANHTERLEEIAKQKVEVDARLKTLRERWTRKKLGLVSNIRELRAQVEKAAFQATATTRLRRPTLRPRVSPQRRQPLWLIMRVALLLQLPRPCHRTCPGPHPEALRAELTKLDAELAALPGETPMMRTAVDARFVSRSDLRVDGHSSGQHRR